MTTYGSLANEQMLYPLVPAQHPASIHTVQTQDSLSFKTSTIPNIDLEFLYVHPIPSSPRFLALNPDPEAA